MISSNKFLVVSANTARISGRHEQNGLQYSPMQKESPCGINELIHGNSNKMDCCSNQSRPDHSVSLLTGDATNSCMDCRLTQTGKAQEMCRLTVAVAIAYTTLLEFP